MRKDKNMKVIVIAFFASLGIAGVAAADDIKITAPVASTNSFVPVGDGGAEPDICIANSDTGDLFCCIDDGSEVCCTHDGLQWSCFEKPPIRTP